ncbi:hypothetical protein [Lentzea cavernae]|uniref:ATP-binding protein n=1 Tax=Lentzea cavernae TaxID=2020703 RepID=A0ABQ3MPY0_9PSEU|nr:hypothetical protein [Lentzea cavernae]GHH56028.1 hypothetical protein GCM10017774_73400 [Lentzea cavernae]
MSRSGLFRAAALLAASAAPLLAGSASAAELPQLGGGLPDVGADKLVADAGQLANPLDAASAVQLPHVGAPVASDLPVAGALPVPALPAAAAERSLPATPGLDALPDVKTPEAHGGNTHLGSVKAPVPTGLPTEGAVPNPTVLSGVLPTING